MLKSVTLIIVLSSFIVSSCTFHRTISDYDSESEFYDSINRQGLEREAIVTLTDDIVYIGSNYKISSDSSNWIDVSNGKRISYHNSAIRDVAFKHHGRGLASGYFLGVAAAIVIIIPINYLAYDENNHEANLTPFLISTGVGAVSIITGAIIGYSMGDKHVYMLHQQE